MSRRVNIRVRAFGAVLSLVTLFSLPGVAYAELPGGWSSRDIGRVAASGRAEGSGSYFKVAGSGADIWNSSDEFRFTYRTMNGDGSVLVKVSSLQAVDSWTKAGVMMRESLDARSKHAMVAVSAAKGIAFQRRSYTGGSSEHTSGGSGRAPYWVRLVRVGDTFSAYKSTDGDTWSLIGRDSIRMSGTIYVGLAVTSHRDGSVASASLSGTSVSTDTSVAAASSSTSGATATSGTTSTTTTTTTLPSGWASRDIGSVGAAGAASGSGSSFTLRGSGADIWGYADEFRFAYKTLTGDGTIVAQVSALENVDAWTKAGVMMRETLSAGSRHAMMIVSPGKGAAFQRRTSTGGASTHTSGGTGYAGYYVKMVRSGSTFAGYKSRDGATWTLVGTQSISMGSTIYVGLAVTSHRDGSVADASFAGTTVTAGATSVPSTGSTSGSTSSSTTSTSLRVLAWNVHHGGVGTDGRYDPDRVAAWIARMNPDVAALSEVDTSSQVSAIVSRLEARTGANWNVVFSGRGNLTITKKSLSSKSTCTYNASYPRVAPHAGIVVNGRSIQVWTTHLDVSSASTRLKEVYNLQSCASGWSEARIIAGDYNMQYLSTEYKAAASTYTDAWLAAKALGTTINYSGNCDGCTRNSRIDYVFSSKGATFLSVASAQVVDTRDSRGYMPSDHKPLLVTYKVK